ncbi:MAG: CoA transferase [Nitrospinae bacterium]|nr:CoA transferase [Nitrospinota bacterium]
MPSPPLPLTGIRVLAVEQYFAGPHGTMLLADAGAEIIKIEPPGTGEPGRSIAPFGENARGERTSHFMLRFNRNKKSLTLNLKAPGGAEIFRDLVKLSDMVWENMRPDVMERLGLGYAALSAINSRLIYVSVSGFGHTKGPQAPYRLWAAFDPVAQGMGGLMYRTGEDGSPPIYSNIAVGDQVPGIYAAFGAMLALRQREVTGRGQHVDISMYDCMLALNEYALAIQSLTGQPAPRGRNPSSAPFGPYAAKDGHVVIATVGDAMWGKFCQAIDREDLREHPQLYTGVLRARHAESVLRPEIERWTRLHTMAAITEIMFKAGVACAPAQDIDDLLQCPHAATRQMVLEIDDPAAGRMKVAGNPVKLGNAPHNAPLPPPRLGQQTDELLMTLLGLTTEDVAGLHRQGVI